MTQRLNRRSDRTFVALCAVLLAVIAGGAAPAPASPATSPAAFVRVNQVGYPGTASKRAYLMSSVDDAAAIFSVRNSSGATI
jgi:Cellulase N-terminal ig-like domain